MYDTIDFYLDRKICPNTCFLDEVPQHLTSMVSKGESQHGAYFIGALENYRVSITKERVKVSQGSLCKYYLGDNFQTLSREDTKGAIEQISDTLHLPVNQAIVTRIDVAQNHIMNNEVGAYLNYLGEARHYLRLQQPHSLYYSNSKRKLVFYDKVREQKSKRQPIPASFQGKNILRYELRFISRIKKQFDSSGIHAKDLYEEAFFKALSIRWKGEYLAINKIKSEMNTIRAPSGKKEFAEQLAFLSIVNIGQNQVFHKIKEWQSAGFINKRQAFELREFIRRVSNIKTSSEDNSLIQELDQKIAESARLC